MFSIDRWQEIYYSIKQNKLRSILTMTSIIWGILILIILLGAGKALQNGVEHNFRQDAVNAIWIWPNRTEKAYKGFKAGRGIQFTNDDHKFIQEQVKNIDKISSRFFIRGAGVIYYKDKSENYTIVTCHPDFADIEAVKLTEGRFINERDIKRHRKTACIGEIVKEALFGDKEAIGEYIKISNTLFKVVGVFHDSERDMQRVYLPITTAQKAFGGYNKINSIAVTTKAGVAESKRIEEEIKRKLKKKHIVNPEDNKAIGTWNSGENFKNVMNIFNGISVGIWIIGIFTLIGGIVGVGNIMIIVVKERTKEIGVRKAIGASPMSVVTLIIQESIVITAVAGYIGLFFGFLLLELLNMVIPPSDFFRDPGVDINIAVSATILLVVAGSLAGLGPAIRAARIKPIEALRDE